MGTVEVPEVGQLPELTGNGEDPVAFANMVLTALLRYDSALLHAEHGWSDPAETYVSWRIQPRDPTIEPREIEVAVSPSLGSFRSVLARFGQHYLGGQLGNGYALRRLRQHTITRRCHFYLSNGGPSGFWIRVYVSNA